MPVKAQYHSRSGASKFITIAQTLCRIVSISAPTIRGRFPDRPALLAVLTAAEGVCELLPAAMDEQVTMDASGLPAFDPGDAAVIPGQLA